MKKYYQYIITTHEGKITEGKLTLSEAKLIPQIIRENSRVSFSIQECSKE